MDGLLEQLRVTLRACVACGEPTDGGCADCEIEYSVAQPLCDAPACRDAHEQRCSRPLAGELVPTSSPLGWRW